MKRLASGLLLLLSCSPGLRGERVAEPVADWSFVSQANDVAFATESGRRFRFVVLGPLVREGRLFLHVATIFPFEDAALEEVLGGAGLRLRADGRLYPLRAKRLTRASEIEPLLETLVRENMKIEATGIRWDPEPERYPGTQMPQWFFRLESEAG